MSTASQNNDNQEIDLSQISKKIGNFFEGISASIFKAILFFKKNIIWVGLLFLIGLGLGIYLDRTSKVYDNEIILIPNFGSVDYVYAKVDLINGKISENDTLFLKDVVGIKKPAEFKKIEIEPITDAYKFINTNPTNFELIKLMSEEGEINKILKDEMTSRNYPLHIVSFITTETTSNEATVQPLLNYLNQSDYYTTIQKEYVNNVKQKMIQNDTIISEINALLKGFSNTVNGSQKSDKLVYYNENSQLNDVIKTKDLLISEQGVHRLSLINLDRVVKENSSTINVKNNKGANGKMKFILPLLFLAIFLAITILITFYRNQLAKSKA